MIHLNSFREYDIRGLVGSDLTLTGVRKLGQAFATMVFRETGGLKIVVGFDGRLRSPEMEQALVMGCIDAGAHVIRIGVGPTPMLYFASHHLNANGAVMVTGSHNPPEYNGFKMVVSQVAIYGEQIQRLRTMIDAADFHHSALGTQEHYDVKEHYVQRLLEECQTYEPSFNLKVAWDTGNGAAGDVLRMLLKTLPGEHCLIHGAIDGTFPAHHPDPSVEENLQDLKDLTQATQCDIGIAFDGDGDRIGVVDECGQVLRVDQLMALYGSEVLKDTPGARIIADVKTGQWFFDYIYQNGGTGIMSRTGHSLIKKKMKESHAVFAGEMSGHLFFADRYYGFDDGLYAALRLLGIIDRQKITLSQWKQSLPVMHRLPDLDIPCEHIDKFSVIQALRGCLEKDQVPFDALDGVRVATDDGWWLVRASNTQEILVIRGEATTVVGMENSLATIQLYLSQIGIQNAV